MSSYVFTGVYNDDWNGDLQTHDQNGQLTNQTFNWSVDGTPLSGLYSPGDPLPTTADDVTIGSAGGNTAFQVVISGTDEYGHTDAAGALSIDTGSSLTLKNSFLKIDGDIANAGTITLHNTGGYGTAIELQSDVSLSGGGEVVLLNATGDSLYDEITGFSATPVMLHNVDDTISGAGSIGTNGVYQDPGYNLTLDNQADGIIDANNPNAALTLNAVSITNNGLLEATGGADLKIASTTVTQTPSGEIAAIDAGSVVTFSNVTLQGGILQANGGELTNDNSGKTNFDGGTSGSITIADSYLVGAGSQNLTFDGSIVNDGTITFDNGGDYGTSIQVGSANLTLTGAGHIDMVYASGDSNYQEITGSSTTSATTFINVDNTIAGAGTIGTNGVYQDPGYRLIFDNQTSGTVDATNSLAALTINPESMTNEGVLEATGSGHLIISNTTLKQSGLGKVVTAGTHASVTFSNTALQGGLLQTNGGTITNDSTGSTVFDGNTAGPVIISNSYRVGAGTQNLTFQGAIDNNGVITLDNGGNYGTSIKIGSDNVTLSGAGQINMVYASGDSLYQEITGPSQSSATLFTNVDNSIVGAGTIGNNGVYQDPEYELIFDNQSAGTVNATNAFGALTVDAQSVTNEGVFEATGSGHLVISHTTLTQSGGGEILANGAHAIVTFSDAIIQGGVLTTDKTNGGELTNDGTGTIVFKGNGAGTLTLGGNFVVDPGTENVLLNGAFLNSGSITMENGGNYGTMLKIDSGGATLSGGGQIDMVVSGADNVWNEITGWSTSTGTTLHNVDNTIAGAGTIGKGGTYQDPGYRLAFDNQSGGIVDATNATNALTLDMADPVSNAGTLESTAAGGLVITSTTVDQFATGMIEALGSGAVVTIDNSTIDNSGGGSLLAGDGAHIGLTEAGILSGTLQSIGTGYFQASDSSSELAAVTNSASIKIGDGAALLIGGATTNAGNIIVDGTNNTATLKVEGTWTGAGKISLTDAAASTVSIVGTWSSDNLISGAGVITGTGAPMVTFSNTGVVDAVYTDHALTISTGQPVTNNGTLEAQSGTLIVDDIVGGTGSALITGGGTAMFNAAFGENVVFQGAGTLAVANASTGIISGFIAGDTIDLTSVHFDSNGSATPGRTSLDVFESGQHYELQFATPLKGGFVLSGDGHNGTDITVSLVPVSSGETVSVTSGQTSANLDVQSGGIVLADGGATQDATVESGGTLIVQSGGVADPTLVSSGGSEVLSAGGTDLGALLSGGIQFVLSGGSASGTVVLSGGEQYVGTSGTSLAAQVQGGGAEVVFGTDSGASLSGTQYDFATASGGTTLNGGYQLVASGAVASGMTVELGGQQYVGSGGTTLGALVGGGGAEVVFGNDSGASLSGTQYLYGNANGGTTFNGGYQLVAPGATASGMTVSSGGYQYIGSGGTAIATDIASQGAQVVFGSALGALVSGTQYDFAYASGGTTYNGGEQLVAFGAVALGMTVESGGQQYVGAGGTALATDIAAQGVEQVFGSDSGALVSGTQYVFGVASGGTTFNGGAQEVEFGDTAIGMTVSSGGQQNVGGGGTAIGTQIMSRGAEIVHGVDLNAAVSGTQYVLGLTSGTVVGTGGYQLVSAGGTISGVSISGGTIELMSGAANGTAPIGFTGAGDLILDASSLFSGTVANFGSASMNDTIDFADITYVPAGSAGATTVGWSQTTSGANPSGTLTVSQGGHSADITLLGQYAVGNFTPSNDGHGGTLITDPPLSLATDPSPAAPLASHQV